MTGISTFWGLPAIGLLVLANAFFVAAEFALVSVRRTRIDELAARQVRGAEAVRRAIRHLDDYIAGTQVGITLASLALGWIGEPAMAHLLDPLFEALPLPKTQIFMQGAAALVAFVFITFLHVILGELVPKSLALQKTERVALLVGRPMGLVVVLFRPLIWSLNGLGNLLLGAFGMRSVREHASVHSVEELQLLVGQSHEAGVLDDIEKGILQHTFKFGDLTVEEVMVPRTEIRGLDATKPFHELLQDAAVAARTRFPLFEESLDNIIGIVYLHDLFKKVVTPGAANEIRDLCRPALAVPEHMRLNALLQLFKEQHSQIAVVVDEYGATAGLITYEDIIEEVTGEVQDITEEGPILGTPGEDGTLSVRGNIRLDELNDLLQTHLEYPSVNTLGGLIMTHLQRMPRVGDRIQLPEVNLEVLEMDKFRIARVALRRRR